MGFSGIGIGEILVILIVVLIVLGPNRLPEIARTLGRAVRTVRKASTDLTTAISRELEANDEKPPPPAGTGQDDTTAGATEKENHAGPGGASPVK